MIPPPAQVVNMITPDPTPSPEPSVAPAYSPIVSAPAYLHAPSYSSPPSSTAAESVAKPDNASYYEAEIMDAEEDNHPGGDWQINFKHELIDFPHAPRHYFIIPGRNNEDTIAPFIRYAMNLVEPSIQATMGKDCAIYTRPITARPVNTLIPTLTPHQEWFFEENQPFSAAIDWGILEEWDITLEAEVKRARKRSAEVQRLAHTVAIARRQLDDARWRHKQSLRAIGHANGYRHIRRQVESVLMLRSSSPVKNAYYEVE